ncbi:prepilin-type N-terminal cleavage/methylation domain-containing protein [Candidatus Parcubacteria bacterium]|nr:prepilin-type N-terminal cleavage/methylation domain-containing protein [Patescibacteria group bacterium]MBU4309270.1 prepilin-type N-terminal cleavage/methylation domain-containing protein [Patescibacteria group bacterium]MBU4432499.1 prepilin-type N-terminal cleavage/methylation domain-containing protein [Patescibacteria group bacterium]MBU4577631.1 prepilin-type N-terminal cleavage/methylation domain-containing protein [Patescibacteria group bacterium]MCG2697317.1 prepilin-type N-terminal
MKNFLKQINNNTAFSIIEVMVAIGIVSVGMMGVLSLMTRNVLTQTLNKNNLIASMLAQEGLELVREVRDTNWLIDPPVSFDDGIPATSTIDFYGFESTGQDFSSSATDIKMDEYGFYGHTGATSTIFKRLITVSRTNPEFINVKSTVRWSQSGKNHDYIAETLLYDWR